MTLDEAIEHCGKVSEELKCSNGRCSAEHLQLKKWLEELRDRRTKEMDELKCYMVRCIDENAITYDVGVMTSDARRAMKDAEESMLEGRHVTVKAVDVVETDSI